MSNNQNNLSLLQGRKCLKDIDKQIELFINILPGNPESNAWTFDEVARIIFKNIPNRLFDPLSPTDRVAIQFALTNQYYLDIKLKARCRIAKLQQAGAMLKNIVAKYHQL